MILLFYLIFQFGTIERVLFTKSRPERLRVEVWDKRAFDTLAFQLGFVDVPLSSFPLKSKTLPLENVQKLLLKKYCGKITLSCDIMNNEEKAKPFSGVQFWIHHHTFKGILTYQTDFKAYELKLKGAKEIFGEFSCPWNEAYPNAQKIFGKKGMLIRAMIRSTFKSMYSKNALKTEIGIISNKTKRNSFLTPDLLFTYVLVDDMLRFSATGSSFAKDFLSKVRREKSLLL